MLGPLKDSGWDYRRLAARLSERFGKGYSLTTLQRMGAGGKLPPREVLDDILALVDAEADGLGSVAQRSLTRLYYQALEITDPDLYRFYQLVEERDRFRASGEQLAAEAAALRGELEDERASKHHALQHRVAELEAAVAAVAEEARQARDAARDIENELIEVSRERDLLLAEQDRRRAEQEAVADAEDTVATALGAMQDELSTLEALPTDDELSAVVAAGEAIGRTAGETSGHRHRWVPGPPERLWNEIEDLDELLRRPPASADQVVALVRSLVQAGRLADVEDVLVRYGEAHTPADTASLARQLLRNSHGRPFANGLVKSWAPRPALAVAVFAAELRRADLHRMVLPLMEHIGATRSGREVGQLARELYGPAHWEYQLTLLKAFSQQDLGEEEVADLAEELEKTEDLHLMRWGDNRWGDKEKVAQELRRRGRIDLASRI
ncbi:hypothetical protein [Streptomyces sp.]|uniref:hypothetical protein n=1 Tax=Streptomyces sp. TaxID=1931 RepID=UPI002D7901FD|nr:hypothetical protein [Streptomyces sp.]HET6354874.1 hypothetical protein [Streptomyces sp.]